MNKKQLNQFIKNKDRLINKLTDKLIEQVADTQTHLSDEVIERVMNKLERDRGGNILNTAANRRLINTVATIFTQFGNSGINVVAETIIKGVQQVLNHQSAYYTALEGKARLLPLNKQVTSYVNDWLGTGDSNTKVGGTVTRQNGYIDAILKNYGSLASSVRDVIVRGVVGQNGWMETRDALQKLVNSAVPNQAEQRVEGLKVNTYFRNFVYDTYSQVDRMTAKMYSDSLYYNFAIYEGGIIATTREFCKEHNGKVYHRSEIAEFDPITAKPPNYDPFLDMGGYACRHHFNWIPDTLAVSLRPSARQFLK